MKNGLVLWIGVTTVAFYLMASRGLPFVHAKGPCTSPSPDLWFDARQRYNCPNVFVISADRQSTLSSSGKACRCRLPSPGLQSVVVVHELLQPFVPSSPRSDSLAEDPIGNTTSA